jgi:D-arabinose 1-dehydrogenase-like Zn-dependent alcohol dehydrogenase
VIANQQFVFPIPEAVASEDAASMFCAGLTVYSPLLRNGCGPGKKVGVIGIGGLVGISVSSLREYHSSIRVSYLPFYAFSYIFTLLMTSANPR